MARIDAAGIAAERQWVTPSDIVDAALANVGALVANRRLDINADSATAIQVDPRLTSSALAHLVENAALYSPADTPLEIVGDVTSDGLLLSIRRRHLGSILQSWISLSICARPRISAWTSCVPS